MSRRAEEICTTLSSLSSAWLGSGVLSPFSITIFQFCYVNNSVLTFEKYSSPYASCNPHLLPILLPRSYREFISPGLITLTYSQDPCRRPFLPTSEIMTPLGINLIDVTDIANRLPTNRRSRFASSTRHLPD